MPLRIQRFYIITAKEFKKRPERDEVVVFAFFFSYCRRHLVAVEPEAEFAYDLLGKSRGGGGLGLHQKLAQVMVVIFDSLRDRPFSISRYSRKRIFKPFRSFGINQL